jgi:hypothetical protein
LRYGIQAVRVSGSRHNSDSYEANVRIRWWVEMMKSFSEEILLFLLLRQADINNKQLFVPHRDMAPLHDLKQLANASGGLFFYVSDQDAVQGLLGALKEALKLVKSQV